MNTLPQGITIEQGEGKIALILEKELYQKEAVFMAAHKFTKTFYIIIRNVDANHVGVYFQQKTSNDNLEDVRLNFCNEVLDQQIRLDLEKAYGSLRNLIVKQAFSPISKPTEDLSTNEE